MIYPDDVIGADDSCVGDPNTGAVYIWGKTKGKESQSLVKVIYNGTGFNITIIGSEYPANGNEYT